PVIPPGNPGDLVKGAVERLPVESFLDGNVGVKRFERPGKPFPIARLDPGNVPEGVWDVLLKDEDGRPIITRMPYGLGQISLFAVSLDGSPFSDWTGRPEFLKSVLLRLGPHLSPNVVDERRGRFGIVEDTPSADLTSDLQRELEKVDVDVVPFGYVALFIVLY